LLPPTPGNPPVQPAPSADGRLAPGPSLGLAAAGFVAGIVLASILGGLAIYVSGDEDGPLLLAGSFVGLWIPLVGAALVASHAFGTGSPGRDLGLGFEPADLLRGVVVGCAGLMTASAVQWLLSAFPDLVGSNTNFIEEQTSTSPGVAIVVVSTLIGAPLVEELFFRGLLLRALARLGVAAAVLQAVVFGMIHVTPDEGLGNVGIMLGVGSFGLVLGLAARHYGRLGPSMVAHVVFNAAAVIPLLL
jgi:membrane protease YdiL (CAAX protease family)